MLAYSAAITKDYKFSGLSNKNLFHTVPETCKFKVKPLVNPVSGENFPCG